MLKYTLPLTLIIGSVGMMNIYNFTQKRDLKPSKKHSVDVGN